MTCWQCGAPLPPDAGFCRGCGAFARPRNVVGNSPGTSQPGLSQSPVALPPAAVSARTPSPWLATSAPASPALRPGAVPSELAPASMLGDVLVAAGAGFVVISLFLTWYSVTLTTVGVQFYESLERALFSRLFPQIANSFGGLTGPMTFSVSALGSGAGGWRWAILVVSIVLLLEVLLVISSSTRSQYPSAWPHMPILLVLAVTNLILVGAAFLSRPYGDTSSSYVTVAPGIGAYLGFLAALVACGGAIAGLVRSRPRTTSG